MKTYLLPELREQVDPLLLEEPLHGLHGLEVEGRGRSGGVGATGRAGARGCGRGLHARLQLGRRGRTQAGQQGGRGSGGLLL